MRPSPLRDKGESVTPESIETVNAAPGPALPARQRRSGRQLPRLGLDRFSGVYALGLIILIFGLIEPALFLTTSNLQTVLAESAITAIMTLAILVPLAAGAFDLSIGAVMSFAVILVAYLQSNDHMAAIPAILITIGVSALIGVLNGFAVVVLRVNSFIATLAMSSIVEAAVFGVSGGNEIVTGISQNFINAGSNEALGLALPFWYMAILAVILYYVLQYTPFGRYLFALGDNPEATRLAGVPTGRLTFSALVISGTIAGIGGVILCARVGTASIDAGSTYLLPAFAAAFLGSTQIRPGRMNVWGAILAVYLLATGVQGLDLAGAASWVGDLFNGLALLLAVSIAMFGARRRQSS